MRGVLRQGSACREGEMRRVARRGACAAPTVRAPSPAVDGVSPGSSPPMPSVSREGY